MEANVVKNRNIGDGVMMPVPKGEIASLRHVLSFSGVLTDIEEKYSIPKTTSSRIIRIGRGKKWQILKLIEYKNLYLEELELIEGNDLCAVSNKDTEK